MMKNCNPHILEYIELIRSGKYPVCTEQVQLIELVERVLDEDGVYIDGEQLEKYLSYHKYFPYDLFPWEKFLFALHNCTYTADGFPRFSHLVIYGGRGLGKNGYLAFENFCLLTNANPVKNYNIYDYANSEKQAKRSWNDVYEVMNDPQNKAKLSRFFTWNSERIKFAGLGKSRTPYVCGRTGNSSGASCGVDRNRGGASGVGDNKIRYRLLSVRMA